MSIYRKRLSVFDRFDDTTEPDWDNCTTLDIVDGSTINCNMNATIKLYAPGYLYVDSPFMRSPCGTDNYNGIGISGHPSAFTNLTDSKLFMQCYGGNRNHLGAGNCLRQIIPGTHTYITLLANDVCTSHPRKLLFIPYKGLADCGIKTYHKMICRSNCDLWVGDSERGPAYGLKYSMSIGGFYNPFDGDWRDNYNEDGTLKDDGYCEGDMFVVSGGTSSVNGTYRCIRMCTPASSSTSKITSPSYNPSNGCVSGTSCFNIGKYVALYSKDNNATQTCAVYYRTSSPVGFYLRFVRDTADASTGDMYMRSTSSTVYQPPWSFSGNSFYCTSNSTSYTLTIVRQATVGESAF